MYFSGSRSCCCWSVIIVIIIIIIIVVVIIIILQSVMKIPQDYQVGGWQNYAYRVFCAGKERFFYSLPKIYVDSTHYQTTKFYSGRNWNHLQTTQ